MFLKTKTKHKEHFHVITVQKQTGIISTAVRLSFQHQEKHPQDRVIVQWYDAGLVHKTQVPFLAPQKQVKPPVCEAGEMAPRRRACCSIVKIRVQIPASILGGLQMPATLAPRDPTTSSGFHRHPQLHTLLHILFLRHTHTHTNQTEKI